MPRSGNRPAWVVPVAPRRRPRMMPQTPRQDGPTVSTEIRQLFIWLRARYWGSPFQTSGFEEDRGPR